MVISGLLTAAGLVACAFFVKGEKAKVRVLKIFALLTVAIHYSDLWVSFFETGSADIADSHLLPIYPCNIIMWMLLITAFLKNRDALPAKLLTDFVFWAGIVCGTIGIVFNENFGNNPTLAEWDILDGLLSHSTMLFGCIYLGVGKFMRVRVDNLPGIVCGLLFFVLDGAIINGLYSIFELDPVNSMYLQHPPFDAMPWLTTPVMGIAGILLAFGVSALYEQLSLPREERWYVRLKNFMESRKNQGEKH